MQNFENLDVEYKEIYVPEIKKEVIAFANTEGGTLYIGIRRDGFVVGVEDADAVMLQVASALKDAIKPDIIPFVRIKAIQREEKIVVEIGVQVGTNRPYYLQEKGLKPSGVYVRRG
ncbi:MAG: ATP-binding protein, partial [Candidatus Metalachnospira sp.]|nr:ATP-binding protein [Candidatus Metalachnospira sp.]